MKYINAILAIAAVWCFSCHAETIKEMEHRKAEYLIRAMGIDVKESSGPNVGWVLPCQVSVEGVQYTILAKKRMYIALDEKGSTEWPLLIMGTSRKSHEEALSSRFSQLANISSCNDIESIANDLVVTRKGEMTIIDRRPMCVEIIYRNIQVEVVSYYKKPWPEKCDMEKFAIALLEAGMVK